jgi:DNA-binding transcriptional ArsR family regulator
MVNYSDAPVLDVLADPTRRAIVALLAERPRPAGEFAARFGISRPAVSRHLRILKSRGLVEEHRIPEDGRVRMVRLRGQPLDDMARWAAQLQAFWTQQLQAYQDFIAAKARRESKDAGTRGRAPRGRGRS